MQAIRTRFLAPTNRRGERIAVTAAQGQRLTVSWDYALNQQDNHDAAAKALATKLGWLKHGRWFRGGFDPAGNVYVCADKTARVWR